ncbi:hypothetical protein AB1Y20_011162 [Prymnesium parvum]|uniref:Procollagen-proline 4-dioxygenase n=1 Tax=Prymnesium parvum TaxID=97485 RepID=A0AB34INS3_PRYPA
MLRPAAPPAARAARALLWLSLARVCPGALPEPACADSVADCAHWASVGECAANAPFMRESCPVSCGTCGARRYSCDDIGDDALGDGDLSRVFTRLLEQTEYTPRQLSSDPWVVMLDSFLEEEEAREVIRVGGHSFERSLAGFGNGEVASRTSSTSWCNVPVCEKNETMLRLKARITDAVQTPWQNTEHLQLLRYEEGQFYLLHHDQNSPVDSAAGPRVFTFFLYLSSVAKGGETVFPRLNLTVHPRAGRALVWASVRDDDVYREDPRTEHEARPVLEGVKYAANFWTHLRDFQTPHAARRHPPQIDRGGRTSSCSASMLLPDGPLGWLGAAVAAGLIYLLRDASSASAPAAASPEPAGEATCRVCYAGAEAGRLFSPCRCSGTMRYVHVDCLNSWRLASVNPRSFFSCEQCGYAYRTQRTRVAQLLQEDRFVWAVSCALVGLIVLLASMVPGNPEVYFYELTGWRPHGSIPLPSVSRFPPQSFDDFSMRLVEWGPQCDRVLAGLLLPSALGFVHIVVKRFATGIDGPDAIFAALSITQLLTMGGLSPALIVPCLIYFWAKLVGVLNPIAKDFLMRFGEVILEVR